MDFDKIDWVLLAKQKRELSALASDLDLPLPKREALEGVLQLCDYLQDQAEAAGVWIPVDDVAAWKANAAFVLYDHYPLAADLVHKPKPGTSISDFARAAESSTGDSLFKFVCSEANDDISADDFAARIRAAIQDLTCLLNGLVKRFNV